MRDSKTVGNITEMQCCLDFMKLGYNTLLPYGDCLRYDFVADVNGTLLKIQVKSASATDKTNSAFRFSCRSSNKENGKGVMTKYSKEEIDYFATFFENQCYLVPVEECGCDKILRLIAPKNGQTKGINFAKDYKLEVILKQYL